MVRIVNKVIDKSSSLPETLLDLTNDTVSENNLLRNEIAHNSEGEPVIGTLQEGGTEDYDDLNNKPQINNTILSGNKTSSQLGLVGLNEKGANNGVASLGDDGKVPPSQIPTADNVVLASAMTIGGQTVTEVEPALHALNNKPSGSGGHTILNESGTEMPQRSKLQFEGCEVTDDSTNDITKIKAEGGEDISYADYQQLTPEQQANGDYYIPDYPDQPEYADNVPRAGSQAYVTSDGLNNIIGTEDISSVGTTIKGAIANIGLDTGWLNLPSTTGTVRYRKLMNKIVNVSIVLANQNVRDGNVIATLPEGFRPPFNIAAFAHASSRAEWDITPDGNIMMNTLETSGVSYSGVCVCFFID